MSTINDRRDPNGRLEDAFRLTVRNILDVDLFTRDYEIFDRLKALKRRAEQAEDDNRSAELHRRINQGVSDALGQPFGASWHDLPEKVRKLRER